MSKKEQQNTTELLEKVTQVPKEKRDFLLGYMQCMVDLKDERTTKRRKNSKSLA